MTDFHKAPFWNRIHLIRFSPASLIPGRGSLGARVFQAGGWNLFQIVTANLLRLLSNLVLTRYLLPEAFGLMAMIGTLLTAFTLFTDIGLSQSITRDRDGDQDHFLRVAWTVKLIRGSVIALAVIVAAILVGLVAPQFAEAGTVYADSRLPVLLAISSLAPFMIGLESTTKDLAIRRLQNARFALVTIATQIFGFGAMLIAVQISPTVWTLVCGMLSANVFGLAASHIFFIGPRMKLAWDREITDKLWTFGKFLLGSSIFTFFGKNADKLILAGLLGSATFGIFIIAQIWVEAGKHLVGILSSRVGFPAVSEVMRTRPREVPRLFRKFQTVIDAICLVAFVVTFAFGNLLINFLYNDTYTEAGRYLSVLSLSFLVTRFAPLDSLILNTGNSRAVMIISAIRGIGACLAIWFGYQFLGLTGALVAVAVAEGITVPYTLYLTRPILGNRQFYFDAAWFLGAILVTGLVYATA